MLKAQKYKDVADIKEICANSSGIIIMHYHGLTVAQITQLRKSLKQNNAKLKIVKNTLSRIAVSDTPVKNIKHMFKGPVAIAYSSDSISVTKDIVEFAKDNEALTILGGVIDGALLDIDCIKKLAKLPSLSILRGQLIGLLQSPATNIVRIIQTPIVQIARVIQAYVDQNNN